MTSFLDYYKQIPQAPATPAAKVAAKPKFDASKFTGSSGSGNHQDFLSWLGDIISRPLYGVTNVIQNDINAAAKQASNLQHGKNPNEGMSFWGNLANAAPPLVNPGFWSTDPKTHNTTSDVIEKATDAIAPLSDPNYKNVANNVNPWVKGIAGFVGDMALDPLTYIPGPDVVTWGKKLAKLPSTIKNIDKGTQAADKAVSQASKLVAPTKKSAVDSIVDSLPKAAPTPAAEQLDLDAIKYIAGKDRTPNQKGIAAVADALGSPAAADAKNVLRGLPTQTVTDVAKAVAHVKDTKPLSFDEWRNEINTTLENADIPMSKAPKLVYIKAGKQVSVPLPKVLAEFDSPTGVDKWVSAALLKKHSQYLNHFTASQSQGKLIDAFSRPVKPETAVKESAVHTVANSLEGFQQRIATDEESVRASLGDDLVDNLKQISNPQKFESVIQKMSGILDGSINVHTLKKLDSPTRQLFKHLGVEPDTIPLGVRTIEPAMRIPQRAVVDYPLEATDAEKAALDSVVKELSNPQIEAEKALRATVDREFVKPRDPKAYPAVSDQGARRTATDYGEGVGRWERSFNGYSIYTLSKNLKQSIAKRVSKLGGIPRAQAFKSLYMPALRLSERWLDDRGIPTYIGVGEDRVQLYFSQILDHLNNVDPKRMAVSFWNGGTAVPDTNLMDAVAAAVNGGLDLPGKAVGELVRVEGPEAIDAALRQTRTRYAKAGQEMENNLLHPKRFGAQKSLSGDKLVSELAILIRKEAPQFRAMAEHNATTWGQMVAKDARTLSDQGLAELDKTLQEATGFGDIIRGYTDTSSRVLKDGEAIGAPQTAIDTAYHGIEGTIDPFVAKSAENYRAVETAVKTAERSGKSAKEIEDIKNLSAFRRFRLVNDEMERAQPFIQGGTREDIGTKIERQINSGLANSLRSAFSTTAGMQDLHELTREASSVLSRTLRDYHQSLAAVQKKLTAYGDRDIAKLAMIAIQKGVEPADAKVAEIANDLKPLVFQVFGGGDPEKAAFLDNAFTREGINIDQANEILARKGLGTEFMFDESAAEDAAKTLGISKDEALARQWRSMPVEDPIDFLSRVYTGFGQAVAHQTLANEFLLVAHDLNMLSKTPRTGFVQLVDDSGKSVLGKYLPENIYIYKDAARQIHVVDSVMRQVVDHTSPMRKFLDNYYIPMLDMWKWGNTLPNPSHHLRNLTGDLSLTFLENGSKNFRKAHQLALKVMANKEYDGYDAVAALQGIHQLPGVGKKIIEGRLGSMTDVDTMKSALARGIMPTFQQAEQLETDLLGKSGLARTWRGLTTSKVGRTVGGVSEARDHYVRLGHYIQFTMNHIDSSKYKSMDELLDAAAEATRKWHPDGSDLTSFERNLKLVIPFYSWTRKAIPLVIESFLTHPGRVNAFNKASYNLAESMGVNPDSLSDPFPTDQMFPSYLTDQAYGPQFKVANKYFGIDPGIPTWDVLDSTIAGNPLQNILGQMAPMVKAPFEVATGTNLGTGSPIHDWSDYIDQSIPGPAQASRLSGVSVTGSLYSLITGQGIQQQYQVAKGNKDPGLSVLNYLTGLGVSPMSNANQISYAQMQRQNTARGSGVGF